MPCCVRQAAGAAHLLDLHAALHGVEDLLAAALGADPDAIAAELAQLRRGAFVLQAVGARDGFERTMNAAALELGGVAREPGMADGEHVVGVPDLVGIVALDDPLHFIGHVGRAAPPVRECRKRRASTSCSLYAQPRAVMRLMLLAP